MTLGLASKTIRDFDAATFKDFLNVHPRVDPVPDSLWFVSEAEVVGEDLNEMDFDVRLSPTSQVPKLWDQINSASRVVFKPPYLSEFRDDLVH